MSNIRTIAVLTDLHFAGSEVSARSKDGSGALQTHVIADADHIKKQYPPGDLLDLIREERLKADAVLCGGDITISACGSGLSNAWTYINGLATALLAETVVATTGNHDIASRDTEKAPEVWESLKRLQPPYPYPAASELQQLMYWGAHFMVAENPWLRVVTLNTCNSHARGEKEFKHGRITDYIIEQLGLKIAQAEDKKINILLCHHHPAKHPAIRANYEEYSEMAHGARLLEELDQHGNDWLVVHGHKHSPRLHYAQGSGNAPAILSAGSFSATLETSYFPTTTNQFYLVDFDMDEIAKYGQVGTIRSWDWIKTVGWVPAEFDESRKQRVITGSGFGMRIKPRLYATKIASTFNLQPFFRWTDVLAAFPELRFVLPDELESLVAELRATHNYDSISKNPIDPGELHKP